MGIKQTIQRYAPYLVKLKHRLNDVHPIFSYPVGDLLTASNDVRKNIRLGKFPILLEYGVNPEPRYGWGKPPHKALFDLIDLDRDKYADLIRLFHAYTKGFRSIPASEGEKPDFPNWSNQWLQGLDAISLYAMPAIFGSKRYVEIGSGFSTKFVRRSIVDNRLPTKITSIDPYPRTEVEAQCDVSIRDSLERVEFDFSSLESGDILMFDGSHRCFQNSDVHVFFLEIVTQLRPGVIIFIHDIFLPYDYRPEWRDKWYSEQYMLGVLLLNDKRSRYDILLPAFFIDKDVALRATAERLWDEVGHSVGLPNGATGFWLRVKEPKTPTHDHPY